MKNPHACVRYSVIRPGERSPPSSGVFPRSSGSRFATTDRMKLRTLGLERRFKRTEQLLGFRRVVGREVAHVDIDRDKAVLGPRVNREVRLGEKHGPGDALRRELMECVADEG